jgi:hypothetical protein
MVALLPANRAALAGAALLGQLKSELVPLRRELASVCLDLIRSKLGLANS